MTQRWLEDYEVGSTGTYGPLQVDQQEIVDFARQYDPQPFHVDPEAAAAGPFGGIIASGWHTCALMMRLFADEHLSPASSLGSPGVDELRWLRPVRPGDRLTLHTTVVEARRSASKPDRGVVRTLVELRDQDDRPVLTLSALNLVLARPAS